MCVHHSEDSVASSVMLQGHGLATLARAYYGPEFHLRFKMSTPI